MFDNKFKVGQEVWVKGIVIGINNKKKHQEENPLIRYSVGSLRNINGETLFDSIEVFEEEIRDK